MIKAGVVRSDRTRVHEEGSLLVWHGGLIFHDSQASLPRCGVEVIHWNFIVSAAEVRVWICDTEVGAVSPGEICVDWILDTVCE